MFKNLLKNNYLIILLLLAVFVNELVFAMVIPLWQNHDELKHLGYTAFLVEEKKIPVYSGPFTSHLELTLSEEIKQANKLLESDKISYGVFEKEQIIHQDFSNRPDLSSLNALSRRVDTTNYKNAAVVYSPLYYLIEAVPYLAFYRENILARSYAMRIFSIIFTLITVYFVWRLTLLIFKNKLTAYTTTILVGFLPRFSYTSAGINNDSLLIALTTVFIYLIIKYLSEPLTYKKALWLGTLAGLGYLSKPQFLVFLPILAVFFLYKFKKGENKRIIINSILIVCALIIILAGWWLLFIFYHYGNFFGPAAVTGNTDLVEVNFITVLYNVIIRYFFLFSSYFFTFGCCHEITMASFFQVVFGVMIGLGLAGLFYYLFTYKKDGLIEKFIPLGFLVLFPLLLEGSLLLIFLKTVLEKGVASFPIDGRYLFPAISSLTILFMIGINKFLPKKIHLITSVALSLGIILFNLIGLVYNILPRFYL